MYVVFLWKQNSEYRKNVMCIEIIRKVSESITGYVYFRKICDVMRRDIPILRNIDVHAGKVSGVFFDDILIGPASRHGRHKRLL